MKEGTIIGLIAGAAIGIAIGSFLSSEEGKQFRRDVKDKVSEHLKNLENDFCAGDAEEDVSEESCNTAEEV
ncbi:unknown [Bacteroides sp. CAG:1060]|nr:unknown [Bacteroides sp. CAG:1060]